MDDRQVANWAAGVVIGLMLAVAAWLLVTPSSGASGGDGQVRVSDVQPSRTIPTQSHSRPGQMQRCVDKGPAPGVSGCVAAFPTSSSRPATSDRRLQRSTRPGAAAVTPPPTRALAPSSATPQPSTPPPTAPARRPAPHHGPVPGGSTSAPHTGPRP